MKITKDIVDRIDLSVVKKSLMKKGMSLESVNKAEKEYKQFLFKLTKHDGIVPTEFIDIIWHEHILNTRDYAKVCDLLFGTFLHHDVSLSDESEITLKIKSPLEKSIMALCVPAKAYKKKALCVPAKALNNKALCVPAKAISTIKVSQ